MLADSDAQISGLAALIVDDNARNAACWPDYLRSWGMTVDRGGQRPSGPWRRSRVRRRQRDARSPSS